MGLDPELAQVTCDFMYNRIKALEKQLEAANLVPTDELKMEMYAHANQFAPAIEAAKAARAARASTAL